MIMQYVLPIALALGFFVSAMAETSVEQSAAKATATISSKIEEQGRLSALKVTDLRASRRDGLLRIQAEISNLESSNQQLYYRFKWLDQDGFSVWDDEPWKPLVVYGGQRQLISVVAPTFKATDFKIVLQSPDNKGL